jgi:predicted aldo/keto reductase-like oxidoreductase
LTEEVKTWAGKAKDDGKIRLFGFSAHKNMEKSQMFRGGMLVSCGNP